MIKTKPALNLLMQLVMIVLCLLVLQAATAAAQDMIVEKKTIKLSQPFTTESGFILKEPVVVYEEYGMAAGPVILWAHGGLGDQHAAGKYSTADLRPGGWDDVIGAGKPLDTRKFRILSMNSLGSYNGTTGPPSINPDTGKPYGPDFPKITMTDMVRFQKAFLDELQVKKLYLMTGVSMGSLQTLNMAAMYPDFVERIAAVTSAGHFTADGMSMHHLLINVLQMDPGFNNGNYDPANPPQMGLKIVHSIGKVYFLNNRIIEKICWDPVADGPDAQTERSEMCREFVTTNLEIPGRDPNSYITVLSAINTHDLGRGQKSYKDGLLRIKCPVLLINIKSDGEFPPHFAQEIAGILNKRTKGQATAAIIDSDWGHMGGMMEGKQIGEHIAKFIAETKNKRQ
jgi:homoserine O-acetyltransferase/O-succinyltransferase